MDIDENLIFPVYIYEDVLGKINVYCRSTKLEIFGYLVGKIQTWKEQTYIIIEDLLFYMGAVHSDKYYFSQVEGTQGRYEKKFQRILRKRKENLLRVGWWHSHPGFGCFLSNVDLITQQAIFPEPYQVALVVDPVNRKIEFFTLDNNSKKKYKPVSYAIISRN
jgi:proteasome lid subunit RPN8/RPN11